MPLRRTLTRANLNLLNVLNDRDENQLEHQSEKKTPDIVASCRRPTFWSAWPFCQSKGAGRTGTLAFDLDGNNIIDADPDLFKNLFPDLILPFQINEKLLNSLPSDLYSSTKYKWILNGAKTETVRKVLSEDLDCAGRNSIVLTQYTVFLRLLEQVMH